MSLNHFMSLRALAVGLVSTALLIAPATLAEAFETTAREALLIDAETGAVLLVKNPDDPMPPASMSKLMTAYMVFERLKDGSLKLDGTMHVSEKAWRMGGSKMFVEVDTEVSVEDLLRGIIVQSGNDACIVIAEALAGSEDAFAEMMTARAREIGLTGSSFANSTGWPDPNHYMTARDLVRLTQTIVTDFPEYFPYFAETSFTYNDIHQGNRNPLLYKNLGADGMKTGHTQAAGYGLTATAQRNGRRLILVINGLESTRKRAAEAARLINYGFREFGNYALFTAGEVVETADVWLGDKARVPLIVNSDLTVTLPRASRKDLKVAVVLNAPVPAPIAAGSEIAKLVISAPDIDSIELPLTAGESVQRLGMFGRIGAAISYLLFGPPAP